MKTLDEQIEYMRGEVHFYESTVNDHRSGMSKLGTSIWNGNFELCQAILDTLLQLKEKSNVI